MSGTERPFYEEAYSRAQPQIEAVRARLPQFSSPLLRVQRVGQLDADLLDEELTDLLAEPVKAALRNVSSTVGTRYTAEIYVLLRLVLYKFSIFDRGASYGAMLQNLKYRNEWAHTTSCTCHTHTVQSTARDAPLRWFQLGLYPVLRILVPYLYAKGKAYMSDNGYADAPSESPEFLAWSLAEQGLRVWNALALVNFSLFLWNGKYRTIADRLLGMRLTYANRALNRNVSFEFLNRQLVWNAFTVCGSSHAGIPALPPPARTATAPAQAARASADEPCRARSAARRTPGGTFKAHQPSQGCAGPRAARGQGKGAARTVLQPA